MAPIFVACVSLNAPPPPKKKKKKPAIAKRGFTLYHTMVTVNNPGKKPFENIVGIGENADNHPT